MLAFGFDCIDGSFLLRDDTISEYLLVLVESLPFRQLQI
jgi:hypothetical protein